MVNPAIIRSGDNNEVSVSRKINMFHVYLEYSYLLLDLIIEYDLKYISN